jgi:DNA-binding response OmpR family regulator
MLQLAFEKHGFDVLTAGDVSSGLTLAGTRSLDAILTDFQLPDFDGLHLCRVLRDGHEPARRPIPIWIMSGSHLLTAAEAMAAGAHDVFRKPFRASEVCERISLSLRGISQREQDQAAQ